MRLRLALVSTLPLLLASCSGWFNPFSGVRGLIAIGLLIAQVIIAYDIVKSRRSVGLKVLWIAFVFLAPLLGILAYLIFERK